MLKSDPKVGALKVMIVEDDPMVRQINEGFLQKIDGFTLVGSYGDLELAKRNISHHKVDLILLDIFFPNGRGIDWFKWLRGEEYQCDVIFITADNSSEAIETATRFGAFDYLIKPFRFERFEEALIHYRNFRQQMKLQGSMNQGELDSLLDKEFNDDEATERDFMNKTHQAVYEYLKGHSGDSYTATEIANLLGLSRITARRYLDELEKEGLIVVEMNYGSVGRPQNRYMMRGEKDDQ